MDMLVYLDILEGIYQNLETLVPMILDVIVSPGGRIS